MSPDALPVCLIGFGLGVPTLAAGFWQLRNELRPRSWVRVSGAVTSAIVEKQASGRGYQFVPKIEYEYRCNDRVLRSCQRRPGNYISGRQQAAENIFSRYPVGASVTVLMNPRQPEHAVLEYGATPVSWIFILVGSIFSGFGLFALMTG